MCSIKESVKHVWFVEDEDGEAFCCDDCGSTDHDNQLAFVWRKIKMKSHCGVTSALSTWIFWIQNSYLVVRPARINGFPKDEKAVVTMLLMTLLVIQGPRSLSWNNASIKELLFMMSVTFCSSRYQAKTAKKNAKTKKGNRSNLSMTKTIWNSRKFPWSNELITKVSLTCIKSAAKLAGGLGSSNPRRRWPLVRKCQGHGPSTWRIQQVVM